MILRMSTTNQPSNQDQDDDLSPEEADELERRADESEEAERNGQLITWEALFPRKRLTG